MLSAAAPEGAGTDLDEKSARMPTYQYRCTECGHDLEVVQKFTDTALTECPSCGGPLRKVFNAVGVVFKGSGFYRTDSRKANGSGDGGSGDGGSGDGGSGTKSDSDSGSGSTTEKSTPKTDASPPKESSTPKPAAASSASPTKGSSSTRANGSS